MSRLRRPVCWIGLVFLAAAPCVRADYPFYDDHANIALMADKLPTVVEAGVPVFHNGLRVDDPDTPGEDFFHVVEIYDRVPGTLSWPLTWADLVANTYLRPTYQQANGSSGSLGTSVVGSVSYRTAAGLQFVPVVSMAEVFTGGPDRIRSVLTARFQGAHELTSTRTFPDPVVGTTATGLAVRFRPGHEIDLSDAWLGSDALRLLTVSSMFFDSRYFDANVLRYEDAAGAVQVVCLNDAMPRKQHLWPSGLPLGDWFELIKTPGSQWYPDSPSIRVDILATTGIGQGLGIQAFLDEDGDPSPNDDSFNVWVEWIDAPGVIPDGQELGADFMITATGPPARGDANLDDCVDGLDYNAWSLHYQTSATWCGGDFNADGTADGLDYNAWSVNYQVGCDGAAAVPGPASAVLLIAGLGPVLRRRRNG